MKMLLWRRNISRWGFVLYIFFITGRLLSGVENLPSLDIIRAAHKSQIELSNPSLKVKYYFYISTKGIKTLKSEYIYVRTPYVLYREQRSFKNGIKEQINLGSKIRYNKNENNYISLFQDMQTNDQYGEIGNGLPVQFTVPDMMDPLLFPIGTVGSLSDLLKSDTVKIVGIEKIDNISCYLLKTSILNNGKQDLYSIWLDPLIGFCPRKIQHEMIYTNGVKNIFIIRFLQYKEINKGVWFPLYVENIPTNFDTNTGEGKIGITVILEAQEVVANQPITKDIIFELPSNCRYYDKHINQMIYPPK